MAMRPTRHPTGPARSRRRSGRFLGQDNDPAHVDRPAWLPGARLAYIEHLCYNAHMDRTIRNLDEEAYRELKARAALTGKTVGEKLLTAEDVTRRMDTPQVRQAFMDAIGRIINDLLEAEVAN